MDVKVAFHVGKQIFLGGTHFVHFVEKTQNDYCKNYLWHFLYPTEQQITFVTLSGNIIGIA